MPRISILIPCLGDPRNFEETLASVLQNRPTDSEVLVVHNVNYHDPYRLGGEVCFIHAQKAKKLADLLNAGFEAACSAVVHVLQCGTEVREHWVEPALAHFENREVGIVSPTLVNNSAHGRVVAAGWECTRAGRFRLLGAGKAISELPAKMTILAPTLAAGFYRRALWRYARWESEVHPQFAPVSLSLAAQACGLQRLHERDCLVQTGQTLLPPLDEPYNFALARAAEQMAWRIDAFQPGTISPWLHWAYLAGEAIGALPNFRAFTGLAGRISAWWQRNSANQEVIKLDQIGELWQAQFKDTTDTSFNTIPFGRAKNPASTLETPKKRRAA